MMTTSETVSMTTAGGGADEEREALDRAGRAVRRSELSGSSTRLGMRAATAGRNAVSRQARRAWPGRDHDVVDLDEDQRRDREDERTSDRSLVIITILRGHRSTRVGRRASRAP